jgi:hypothetical protein
VNSVLKASRNERRRGERYERSKVTAVECGLRKVACEKVVRHQRGGGRCNERGRNDIPRHYLVGHIIARDSTELRVVYYEVILSTCIKVPTLRV